jgi:hypothetical protein
MFNTYPGLSRFGLPPILPSPAGKISSCLPLSLMPAFPVGRGEEKGGGKIDLLN